MPLNCNAGRLIVNFCHALSFDGYYCALQTVENNAPRAITPTAHFNQTNKHYTPRLTLILRFGRINILTYTL